MKVDYLKDDKVDGEQKKKEARKEPRRIMVSGDKKTLPLNDKEILIVASKLKKYIKDKHGLNTSASVMEVLSNIIRVKCDSAVDQAMREGRKTLLDRDF